MQMPSALLAGSEADFPHVDRCDISAAKDRIQELFPLNCLLCHAHYDAWTPHEDSRAVMLLA
jgi:hypothetical protein